jgi:hypothetical protein
VQHWFDAILQEGEVKVFSRANIFGVGESAAASRHAGSASANMGNGLWMYCCCRAHEFGASLSAELTLDSEALIEKP